MSGSAVGLNITIVGSSDRQLEELLRGQDMRVKSLPVNISSPSRSRRLRSPTSSSSTSADSNALPPTLSTFAGSTRRPAS